MEKIGLSSDVVVVLHGLLGVHREDEVVGQSGEGVHGIGVHHGVVSVKISD